MKEEFISLDTAKKLAIYEKNLKQKIEYKKRIDKAIEYINEMCLCSDDLNPEHIIKILKGGTNGLN